MGMQQASDLTSDQSDSDVSDDPHNGSSGEDFPTVLSSLNSDLKGDAKTGMFDTIVSCHHMIDSICHMKCHMIYLFVT